MADDKLGKLDHRLFEQMVWHKTGFARKEVTVGPQFGVDVSVTQLPDGQALCATSDPLSLIPALGLEESAWLSVHLMANDMATTGFAPQYGQFVLNLPATFSKSDFEVYWGHIHRFCKDLELAITGGHTGFIEGQNSTISGGGTFFTVAPAQEVLTSRGGRPGDAILVTKQAGLLASAILALSFPDTVKQRLGQDTYEKASERFYHTSSLADALVAKGSGAPITAMHDVTEGGVLGAIYELASASDCGAHILHDQLPVGESQQAVCELFGIDSRQVVGAGSMVITCPPQAAEELCKALITRDIACAQVGALTTPEQGVQLEQHGKVGPLDYQEEDPYWAAFFTALKQGWT